ncbi:MAG: adenosine kinase [Pseudomonadota bacterium]
MSEKPYDVLGIGNAIVDIIAKCDDALLAKHDAPKGSMRLIDGNAMDAIFADMSSSIQASGGSASNTMVGIASFGGKSAFIGKLADDAFGKTFAEDLKAAGVEFQGTPIKSDLATGRSLILVTPDGQRTMNTALGISSNLSPADVDEAEIAKAKIVYLEGYLFDRDDAKAAFQRAAQLAKTTGAKVALTLSDAFCVERHRDSFLELIRNDVDILFANEAEILSLYQTEDFAIAVSNAAADTALAALTRSENGSLILADDERIEIAALPVEAVVDTTGAGDLYAAGFLYGLSQSDDLKKAGQLGSLAASEIISHLGARPERSLQTLATEKNII